MNTIQKFVTYSFDGNADSVEIDGVTYEADPNDPNVAKIGDDGKPVVFKTEEPPTDPPADPPKDSEDADTKVDASTLSLEELKKLNPEVAKLVQSDTDARKKLEDAEAARQTAEEETLKKNGEWQKLAETAQGKAKTAESEAKKNSELLGKYKGTIDTILTNVKAQIQSEKLSLIPDGFSSRQQLEYISANAQWFGVTVANKGGGVPPNENDPPTDEEGALDKELTELMAKDSRTHQEDARMGEVATKLKEVRKAKADSQKT